jgi:hypothetical protein
MFAGRDYQPNESFLQVGDHIIPIVDMILQDQVQELLRKDQYFFLWDDYSWDGSVVQVETEGRMTTDVASPGFFAAANSYMDFVNVVEGSATWSSSSSSRSSRNVAAEEASSSSNNNNDDDDELWHRSKDPGVGGFSLIHSRKGTALTKISAGSELFVSYGSNWYVCVCVSSKNTTPLRKVDAVVKKKSVGVYVCMAHVVCVFVFWLLWWLYDTMQNVSLLYRFLERPKLGPIPIKGDHAKAQQLYLSYKWNIIDKYKATSSQADLLHQEVWETFVLDSAWKRNSRILAAFPPLTRNNNNNNNNTTKNNMAVYNEMVHFKSLIDYKKRQMIRSPEWLNEHGVCADTLRILQPSTIRQAGRGVVADRFLAKDTIVLPVPLIPIPNRTILEMQRSSSVSTKNGSRRPTTTMTTTHYQLLLNYCLGHEESSLLLSPYGPGFSLINHNQTLANVKLQWADPERSNHHPELLQQPISSLYQKNKSTSSRQLAMEVVALRDIVPGEELFLDYGNAWEAAWHHHVRHWKPVPGADQYRSAEIMNQQNHLDTAFLLTEFEQLVTPYPSNVALKFNDFFLNPTSWSKKTGTTTTVVLDRPTTTITTTKWMDCDILQWRKDHTFRGGPKILYTIVVRYPSTTTATDGPRTTNTNNNRAHQLVKDVPREAFQFVNRPYTSDMLLPNAFRHDIRIPDEIFPERWKNLKHQRDGPRRRSSSRSPLRTTKPRGGSSK